MTDTNAVSTLTNNSVSFDISGLRHFEEGDNIWFCLVDIGRMLELADNATRMMKTNGWFDSDEINTVKKIDGGSDITYVSESALYRIINRSNSPKARPFERWVTKEVLPSIRKTGSYSITRNPIDVIVTDEDPVARLEAAKQLILEERAKQEAKRKLVEERAEKAETTVKLLTHTRKTYTATELAKELGYKSAIAFNKWLADIKFQFKQNGTWLTYSYYSDNDYVSIKQEQLDNGHVIYNRRFTDKGREFLIALHKDK